MNKFASYLLLIAIGLLGAIQSTQAQSEIYTPRFSSLALKGYDAVSYFLEGRPSKGTKEFSTKWKGATWQFASEKNLNLFLSAPEEYAPQYGGYCAWAIANDKLAKGDPLVYTLLDGKLYLNFNRSVDKTWQQNRAEFIEKADLLYPILVQVN